MLFWYVDALCTDDQTWYNIAQTRTWKWLLAVRYYTPGLAIYVYTFVFYTCMLNVNNIWDIII